MSKLNAAQKKVLTYLADPARTYPAEMATALAAAGIYNVGDSTTSTENKFTTYLEDNRNSGLKFCSEGITRAYKALGLTEKKNFKKGDVVYPADIVNLPPGTGFKGDVKIYMVKGDKSTICQDGKEGKEKNWSSSKTLTLVYVPDTK